MAELADTAQRTRAWACYDCGKCTATCPIARAGSSYSPRRHVLATNLGQREAIGRNGAVYTCLTCSLCDQRCPAEVDYTSLVRSLRELTRGDGVEPECPHGGALQSLMRMMARGSTQQDRLAWLSADLKTQPKTGELFYWTGCAMYYDAFFTEFELATLNGVKAAIRLLNAAGVEPVVSPQERCCGHDLLWNGDRESFALLAKHNVGLVEESGARLLVTSCAECLRTWKLDYEPYFTKQPPRILHLTEFLLEQGRKLALNTAKPQRVTLQDPCRLGRHLGIYDPPRDLLKRVPGVELREMRRSGAGAICCAGGTWSHCDRFAKRIQVQRLKEARASGADVLVTSCPKCQIHLRCAMKDPNLEDAISIPMCDVAEVAAGALDSASEED